MASLLFKDSQGREGTVELSPTDTVFVGRGLDCAIRTDDGLVSRRHAQFAMENGRFVVEDLGSANGTHLNGVKIQKQAVQHSDVVQCGSLIVRFVDQGGTRAGRNSGGPPPKRGGTMALDRPPNARDASAAPAGGGGASDRNGSRGGPGGPPGQGGAPRGARPPSQAQPASAPVGGPPAMPSGGMSFGGPPAMPSDGSDPNNLPFGGPPSMPGRDQSGIALPPRTEPGSRRHADPTTPPPRFDAEVQALRLKLEQTTANYEREVADGKRARAEAGTLRDRIEELRVAVRDHEEQVAAHDRVSDQLRDELQQLRDDYNKLKAEMSELTETAATRERQAARAQEEVVRVRDQMQDLNRQLMELSRTKDEGWTKLNDQLGELDQLRSVINEQERMLEDRRVGLVSQEHLIKELRTDQERSLQTIAQLRAEREQAVTQASRTNAQVVAIEEENRRLGRLLVEAHSDHARGGDSDHMMRLTADLKDVRVELKKLEADRDRVQQQYETAERERRATEDRIARTSVELQEALQGKLAAESSHNLAQEALAKADVARLKAVEEAVAAAKAAATAEHAAVQAHMVPAASPAAASDVAERAQEIYETINDILSEMRNNMLLVEQELPNLTANEPTKQTVDDAVEALVDSVETAKGALRGLRDLAEGKS